MYAGLLQRKGGLEGASAALASRAAGRAERRARGGESKDRREALAVARAPRGRAAVCDHPGHRAGVFHRLHNHHLLFLVGSYSKLQKLHI